MVNASGTHCLSCRCGLGRLTRHQLLNDIVWHALVRAGVPAVKEPMGLSRTDGKQPDGMSLIPWKVGRCVMWDMTVADTMAVSYLPLTSVSVGAAAEGAALRKNNDYYS